MSLLVSQISTRQWATITWVIIFMATAGRNKSLWVPIGGLLKAFRSPKLLFPYIAIFTTGIGIISLLSKTILWQSDQLLSTLIFISASSFIALSVAFQNGFNRDNIPKLLINQISVGFLLATYANLYSLPFILEMLVQPITLFLVLISLTQKQMGLPQQFGKYANALLGGLNIGIFLFVGSQVAHSLNSHEVGRIAREFITPVLVTAMTLPTIWLLSLIAIIDTVNLFLKDKVEGRAERFKFLFWLFQSKQIGIVNHASISPFQVGQWHEEYLGL